MVMATNTALAKTGLTWDDIDWFVPHQANLRINEAVVEYAEIPKDKALNSIMFYGNTTAATVPLTIDHYRKEGKVKKGDLVLYYHSVVGTEVVGVCEVVKESYPDPTTEDDFQTPRFYRFSVGIRF